MKNIFRYVIAVIVAMFFVTSCSTDDDYRDWTTPEPTFKLHESNLGTNVLYPSMEANPYIVTWESVSGASEYTVEISTTEDFATPVTLGTSTTNSYKTTVGALNTALLQAGYAPYSSQKVYMRVKSGSQYSNVVSFDATTYPTSKPVITAPTAGTSLALDAQNPANNVTSVTWKDYGSYGVAVNYLVEVAQAGGTNWQTLGSTTDVTTLDVTNKMLNDALIKAGFAAGVEANADIRVTASTTSTGGTITQSSDVVTVKVIPYIAFKDLYLVGEATAAGWNTNNNNQALFRDPVNTNKFHFSGYFTAGGFKVLENLGDNTWHPQWGQNDGVVSASNADGSNEPGTFNIPSAGYYTFELDIVAKTFSLNPYTPSAATYARVGYIGDATPTGWGEDTAMLNRSTDPHQWYAKDVNLVVGAIKFRANNDWGINWGSNSPISGTGTPGGDNIPVEEAGVYDIYFNSSDGSYQLVKK